MPPERVRQSKRLLILRFLSRLRAARNRRCQDHEHRNCNGQERATGKKLLHVGEIEAQHAKTRLIHNIPSHARPHQTSPDRISKKARPRSACGHLRFRGRGHEIAADHAFRNVSFAAAPRPKPESTYLAYVIFPEFSLCHRWRCSECPILPRRRNRNAESSYKPIP